MAVKLDGVAHIQTLYFPGVAKIEPVVWLLMLEAIHQKLHESNIKLKDTMDFRIACYTFPHVQMSETDRLDNGEPPRAMMG